MEKTIRLFLADDLSIKISVNDSLKKEIPKENRVLFAQEIYEILDYTKGDTYNVITQYEGEKEKKVVESLETLFKEITDTLNSGIEELGTII